MPTHYDLLGVARNSTPDEIRKSYLAMAFDLHPDRTNGDKAKTEKFMQVKAAYDTLSDSTKRAEYDRSLGAGAGHWNDMFSRFNPRPRPTYTVNGTDVEIEVIISLMESYTGCEKDISYNIDEICPMCDGAKVDPDSPRVKCHICAGSGMKYDFIKKIVTPCIACEGRGRMCTVACSLCQGMGVKKKPVQQTVAIPESIRDGATVKYVGLGSPGLHPGDLLLTIRVAQLEDAVRQKNDLYYSCLVPLATMISGGLHTVKSPVGTSHEIEIFPKTQSGEIKTIKGTGFLATQGGNRGDMKVRLMAAVPILQNESESKSLLDILKGLR